MEKVKGKSQRGEFRTQSYIGPEVGGWWQVGGVVRRPCNWGNGRAGKVTEVA